MNEATNQKITDKTYALSLFISQDDDNELELTFRFQKPKTASYDRYIKSMSQSAYRASRDFALDNVLPEDETKLKDALEEYPAMALTLGEKLMGVLGLAKTANLKLL